MSILHIYGDIANFLIFCDHQDTESESNKIEINIYQPIFTHKKISKVSWENYIHTLQYGKQFVVILHIYGARVISLPFCVHQDTVLE